VAGGLEAKQPSARRPQRGASIGFAGR